MAFDYKKEYKEFYMPKNKPGIIEIPKMNYIASEYSSLLLKVLAHLLNFIWNCLYYKDELQGNS